MSEFASGLFAPFIVTEILTTLGATFFDNRRKAVAVLQVAGQRIIVDLDMQRRVLRLLAILSVVHGEACCYG